MPPKAQSRSSHARFDPAFHFSLVPASVILVIWTIVRTIRHFSSTSFIEMLTAVVLFWAIFLMRIYSLKVQDRVIRLEERLRLSMLLPESLQGRIPDFSIPQLIALRFASDAELPSLAQRALAENLTNSQIKDAIQTWRADNYRV